MDFADQAAALYALPLDRFTDARNAAAKDASQAGDKDLAAALRQLPKPASAAWLVNQLVNRRRDEVEQVLELGASLKEAQAGLDRAQLHALGQQRQRLLAAVARQSLEAAAEVGYDVGAAALPGVEQTLRAALADPSAAAAVLTGRLVRTLEGSGWDPVDLDGAVAGPFTSGASGAPREPAPRTVSARERKEAEARLASARDALAAAEEAVVTLQRRSKRLAVRREGVAASIEDLEERLDALRRERADLDAETAALDRETREADRKVAEAGEAADDAASTASTLGNGPVGVDS